jgi:hypothetical protein
VNQQEADDVARAAAAAAAAAGGGLLGGVLPSSHRSDRDTSDQPFLTGVLLRAVADVAAGREVVSSAIHSAEETQAAAAAGGGRAGAGAGANDGVGLYELSACR